MQPNADKFSKMHVTLSYNYIIPTWQEISAHQEKIMTHSHYFLNKTVIYVNCGIRLPFRYAAQIELTTWTMIVNAATIAAVGRKPHRYNLSPVLSYLPHKPLEGQFTVMTGRTPYDSKWRSKIQCSFGYIPYGTYLSRTSFLRTNVFAYTILIIHAHIYDCPKMFKKTFLVIFQVSTSVLLFFWTLECDWGVIMFVQVYRSANIICSNRLHTYLRIAILYVATHTKINGNNYRTLLFTDLKLMPQTLLSRTWIFPLR